MHRSGRTARQAKEGLSIMLVQAQEVKCFRKVCKGLNRGELKNKIFFHITSVSYLLKILLHYFMLLCE